VQAEFYNAGDKIDEVLLYSIPTGSDIHALARYNIVAPREEFFSVPTEMTIQNTGETIAVQFQRDIPRKWGDRGVIKIDPAYDPEQEDPEAPLSKYPFARTRQEAVSRGRELWSLYLRSVVESHLADCEAARAAGGAPRSARGFTKRALKLLGIQDPGEQYFNSLTNGGAGQMHEANPQVAAMQAQMQMMMAMLMAVATGEKLDPAKLAELMKTPNAIGVDAKGAVVTSGVATGEIKKPIAGPSGYERETAGGKEDRRKKAEAHL